MREVWGRQSSGARGLRRTLLATSGVRRQPVVRQCGKYYAFGDTNMPDTSSKPVTPNEPAEKERAATPVSPVPGKDHDERPAPDPTRYGDWEKNGRCIDF